MTVRHVREDELGALVDDLWLPFAREMAELDPSNELADDVRDDAAAHRERQFADDDVATFVTAVDGGGGDGEEVEDVDGGLAGYAVVERSESPPVFARGPAASVEEVDVRPDYRGMGVATDLMDRAEAWGAERGCERAVLGVNADNDAAQRLYESRGYEVRRHKMYGSLE